MSVTPDPADLDHGGEKSWSLGAGLEDRCVIVTGAAQGIGRACAEAFASVGARVAAIDKNSEGVEDTVAGFKQPGRHVALQFDLADVPNIQLLVKEVQDRLGDIWALAHVAAVLKRQPLEEVTEADWDLQLDVNLKAAFFLNKAVGELMVAAGRGGRIINFTSGAWLVGPIWRSDAYAASKGGIVTMTRGFARNYGRHGILVNSISPGQIDTPMQHIGNPPDFEAVGMNPCPLGRMGEPEEVAAVALFLASEHSSFVNGATINVSGGLIMY